LAEWTGLSGLKNLHDTGVMEAMPTRESS